MKKKPVVLMILDGFGIDKASSTNAISLANKPNLDSLMKKYDVKTLEASGEAVGLPEGQMGNSEVGHLNIGAGRIVYQSLTRINKAIKDKELENNKAINNAINHAIKNNSKFHIFGLASDGGVHSHTKHIIAIANIAASKGIKEVYYHAFLDGRDVAPKSALIYLDSICANSSVKVATVSGRYYAMDRDRNYERIQVAYDAITRNIGPHFNDYKEGIEASYNNDITDEFVLPFICDDKGMVSKNDAVVFANFRPDRAIAIATAISNPNGIDYNQDKPYRLNINKEVDNIYFVSMMKYSDTVKGELAFELQELKNLLGDVVSDNGLKQLRIAETEKYAHVTFFMDGGADREIYNAKRILVNSPNVATYDLKPEMSAYLVTDKLVEAIKADLYDLIIVNYANCDMVGHTGNIEAAKLATEAVDKCVGLVMDAINEAGGVALITADHGNAEKMADSEGKPFTAHTTNLVPVLITDEKLKIRDGILSDIAPTLLELLGIDIPSDMESKSLIV